MDGACRPAQADQALASRPQRRAALARLWASPGKDVALRRLAHGFADGFTGGAGGFVLLHLIFAALVQGTELSADLAAAKGSAGAPETHFASF